MQFTDHELRLNMNKPGIQYKFPLLDMRKSLSYLKALPPLLSMNNHNMN